MPYVLAFLTLLLIGCGSQQADGDTVRDPASGVQLNGDVLRVLMPVGALAVPRGHDPLQHERAVVEDFAAKNGWTVEIVAVGGYAALGDALLTGMGDLIAANYTVTDERSEKMQFTEPLGRVHELLVGRAGKKQPRSLDELNGTTIGVQAGTSYVDTARALRAEYPGNRFVQIPADLSYDEVLERVTSGGIDYTILDDNLFNRLRPFHDGVVASLDLSLHDRPIAWGVAPDQPDLLAAAKCLPDALSD
ncbi:MAG: transporter substrate-binding domain-containing protein [Planctomycetota bacterium]|jgi:membrane-bound lytic murein transglycosylase F|nr:transporter substrate-binding domain-containing protein [Planctomycetota bacterium]